MWWLNRPQNDKFLLVVSEPVRFSAGNGSLRIQKKSHEQLSSKLLIKKSSQCSASLKCSPAWVRRAVNKMRWAAHLLLVDCISIFDERFHVVKFPLHIASWTAPCEQQFLFAWLQEGSKKQKPAVEATINPEDTELLFGEFRKKIFQKPFIS